MHTIFLDTESYQKVEQIQKKQKKRKNEYEYN